MSSFSSYRSIHDTRTSNGLSRTRYFRPRFTRRRSRYPRYSNPRVRPIISDRDRRFIDWLRRKLRERELINRGDESSDGDDGDVDPTEGPDGPEVPEPERSRRLHVTDVDLHITQNTQSHHTDMYECTEDRIRVSDRSQQKAELVIRRGEPFLLTIKFNRPYDISKNDVTLTFTLAAGEGQSTVKETFKVNEDKSGRYKPRRWGATLVRKEGISLTLEVFVPAACPIGAWELGVKTIVDVEDGNDLIWQYNHNEEINILFNPWCRDDTVYMSDQTWLNEAVLNDNGAYYYGNARQMGSDTWYYGQFDDGILDIALHLLRRGFDFRTSKAMGNAVRVARVLSKIVNSQDDNGVLVGNWSGNFSGGVSPTTWKGSVRILRQYMKTGKPVKYAQCWVYAMVLTTVCRAVGLPCRSLSNFESAHNTDEDHLSFDRIYYMKNGEMHWDRTRDSIWNFHVWNEVWMSRPDLGREFDGWQAIDATPQETSEGVYCCGPAPLKAIKEGQINIGYDTPFVFAEVNADKVAWRLNRATGEMKLESRESNKVGMKISTKQPTGSAGKEQLDITDQYKYPEGSQKEREIVRKAERLYRYDNLDVPEEQPLPAKPVELEIVDKDDIFVGSGFDVEVVAFNGSDKQRTINLSVTVHHKTYFGRLNERVASQKFSNEILEPGERKTFSLQVTSVDALRQPKEGYNFQIQAVAVVAETDNVVTEIENFRLRRPDITAQGPTNVRIGESFNVELSFTNPLSELLTNCVISIDGGLEPQPPQKDSFSIGHLRPEATWTSTVKLVARRVPGSSKERVAIFGLESDQLKDITGSFTVKLG